MSNDDIRKAARVADVKLWQVAEELGIADATLSRKLRKELDDRQREEILKAITHLKDNNEWR